MAHHDLYSPRARPPYSARAGAKYLLTAFFALASGMVLAKSNEPDLTALSLEELLKIEVYSTSRYLRSVGQSPSEVSVVTAEDIKVQGYRSLADILRALPGLYVTSDRSYSYLGARGFGRPEDYNSRVLFLLDGDRLNENVYDSMLLGNEAILDVELIERLEYIPGPGAAILHGKNAVFGVVNIITRNGAKIDGLTLSGDIASAGGAKGRATFGRRMENGLDLVLSASRYESDGRNLYFPEFGGTASGLDFEEYQRLFAKLTYGNLTLLAAHSGRNKGIPNAPYGQLFDVPGGRTLDKQTALDLGYNHPLENDSAISGRLYYGNYDFTGDYVYDSNVPPNPLNPSPYINRDKILGKWVGADLRYVSPRLGRHKWLLGADYQLNLHQDQTNQDVGGAVNFLDPRRNGKTWGCSSTTRSP